MVKGERFNRVIGKLAVAIAIPVISLAVAVSAGLCSDIEKLQRDLQNPNFVVRLEAVERVAALRDPRSVELLVKALRDPHEDVRRQAAGALGELRDPRSTLPLVHALSDPKEPVRQAAEAALLAIGPPVVEPLAAALSKGTTQSRAESARLLGKIAHPSAVKPLIRALNDRDAFVRKSAGMALVEIDSPAISPLLNAMKGKDPARRLRVARVLCEFRDPEALAQAIEPLSRALKSSDRALRIRAADALGKTGDSRAVRVLVGALKSQDRFVRAMAARSLGRIGHPAALGPLQRAMKDQSVLVREEAKDAVDLIRHAGAARLGITVPTCSKIMRIARNDVWWPASPIEIGQKISSETGIQAELLVSEASVAEGLLRFCVKCKGDRGAVEFHSPARSKPFSVASGCSGKKRQEFREFLRFPAHRRALDDMLKQRRGFSR
jgi:HEAT repeat protein